MTLSEKLVLIEGNTNILCLGGFMGTRETITMISPMWIKKELDKVVAGQEEAKKALSILGYNHYLRFQGRIIQANKLQLGHKNNMGQPPRFTGLITGPTGTGKTYLIETLANILTFPYLKIDATQLTREGFSGMSINDFINTLQEKYKGTIQADYLDTAIIFIDEVDKLGHKSASTKSDDHNREIQCGLLSFVDGFATPAKAADERRVITIDTTKMLFIFGGAFESAYKERREKKQAVGFLSETKKTNEVFEKNLTREELEQAGIIRELLGRIHVITHTNKLSRENIREVLFNVSDNIIGQFRAVFELSDIAPPNLDEGEINKILDSVEKDNSYGLRFLKTILFEHYQDAMFELDCDIQKKVDELSTLTSPEEAKV